MRKAEVKMQDVTAGWLAQDDQGYHFVYDPAYLSLRDPEPVSKTLPLQEAPYQNSVLFPFFDGLIPEGWLLDVARKNWKLNPRDRMGLLMACCKDCIGAVSIIPIIKEDQ